MDLLQTLVDLKESKQHSLIEDVQLIMNDLCIYSKLMSKFDLNDVIVKKKCKTLHHLSPHQQAILYNLLEPISLLHEEFIDVFTYKKYEHVIYNASVDIQYRSFDPYYKPSLIYYHEKHNEHIYLCFYDYGKYLSYSIYKTFENGLDDKFEPLSYEKLLIHQYSPKGNNDFTIGVYAGKAVSIQQTTITVGDTIISLDSSEIVSLNYALENETDFLMTLYAIISSRLEETV